MKGVRIYEYIYPRRSRKMDILGILTLSLTCGYNLVVEFLVANERVGVRFSLSAQNKWLQEQTS